MTVMTSSLRHLGVQEPKVLKLPGPCCKALGRKEDSSRASAHHPPTRDATEIDRRST